MIVLAIGGGGDIVTAAVLAEKLGAEVGLLPWERFVVDPVPGPLTSSDFMGAEGDGAVFVLGPETRARRGERIFKPQGACAASVLGRRVYAVSPDRRPSEVGKALASFGEVVGVDVGGDVLAQGCEPELHSPLADSYSLAVLKRAEEAGAAAEVAVVGLGADGELPRRYLMGRAALLMKNGGFRGYYALGPEDVGLLERLTSACVTEASAMILRALRGHYGEVPIRGGSRLAYVDAFTPVALRFSPGAVLEINDVARIIYEEDLDALSAARRLRELGFTTEYDFEEYIAGGLSPEEALRRAREDRRCG